MLIRYAIGVLLLLKMLLKMHHKAWLYLSLGVASLMGVTLAGGKIWQHLDRDPLRGALAMEAGLYGESFPAPVYLDQGWSAADTLWYYNTSQGSGLLPYDFFIALEQRDSPQLMRAHANMDRYRYLPQKATFFNPDALAVGFVRDTYKSRDYVGFTCAACHTRQINYQDHAIRIDGAPAMADMVGFLEDLHKALQATQQEPANRERFVQAVLSRNNDYHRAEQVITDLEKWTAKLELYNTVNHSHIDYGFARLDAFGRIYNRVLEHVLNKQQLRTVLLQATSAKGEVLLTQSEADLVLEGVNETIIGDGQLAVALERLQSSEPGYPALDKNQVLHLRNTLFNEPNAPVSYPFLWGITHSDYVQWNGLASNAGIGPLGRNAGTAHWWQ